MVGGAHARTERVLETFRACCEALLGNVVGPIARVRLFDASGPWRASLTAEHARLRLAQPSGAPAFFRHSQFELSYEGDAPRSLTRPLEDALERHADALADALRAARDEAFVESPELAPFDARACGESALLGPFADAYRAHYGEALQLARWSTGPPSIVFPDVAPEQSLFLRPSAHFVEDVRFAAYLSDLGYGVRGGQLRVVPTPSAFVRRRAALGLGDRGFTPRLFRARTPVLSSRRWLRGLAEGVFPINVRGPLDHRLAWPLRSLTQRLHPELETMWHTHFHALGHDMSLHVFGMHRLNAARVAELRRRATRGARVASPWVARAIAQEFEGALTRRCVDAWNAAPTPAEFEAVFDATPTRDD